MGDAPHMIRSLLSILVVGLLSSEVWGLAKLQFEDPRLFHFGQLSKIEFKEQTFVITNVGDRTAGNLMGSAFEASLGISTEVDAATELRLKKLNKDRLTRDLSHLVESPFRYKGGTFPGAGGTCKGVLEAGKQCTVVVTYLPKGTQLSRAFLTLSYHNGEKTVEVKKELLGRLMIPARLQITSLQNSLAKDAATPGQIDFGSVALSRHKRKRLLVVNSGEVPASRIEVSSQMGGGFEYEDGSYPGRSGTCGSTLVAGGRCSLVVIFSAQRAGLHSSHLALNYHAGPKDENVSVELLGTGIPTEAAPRELSSDEGRDNFNVIKVVQDLAKLALSEKGEQDLSQPIVFQAASLGRNVEKTIVLSNEGGGDAYDIRSSKFADSSFDYLGGQFPGKGGSCSERLAPGDRCELKILFTPQSNRSIFYDFNLTYHNGKFFALVSRKLLGETIPR